MHGELLRRLDEDRDLVSGAMRGGLARGPAPRAYLNQSREALVRGNGRHPGSRPSCMVVPLDARSDAAVQGRRWPSSGKAAAERLLAFPGPGCKLWLT
jgi:hypothetical protein